MAFNPLIESNRMYMAFPLSDDFIIGNGHFRLKIFIEIDGKQVYPLWDATSFFFFIGKVPFTQAISDMLDIS